MFEMDFRFPTPEHNKPLHIVVEVDDITVIFSDGILYSDNQNVLDEIAMASFSNQTVYLTPTGPSIEANLMGKPINVFAAIVSPAPHKWFIKEAPESITKKIFSEDTVY